MAGANQPRLLHTLVGLFHTVWWVPGFFILSGGSLGVRASQVGLLAPKTQVCTDCLAVVVEGIFKWGEGAKPICEGP